MKKAVLFDLDGTLVDSLPDIAAVMNAVLGDLGFPGHAPEEYKAFVGWGSRELARLALPERERTEERISAAEADMKRRYEAEPVARSRPYPGIPQALAALKRRGYSLAVLSNKPDAIVRPVVRMLFPGIRFSFVSGARDGVPHKPDPSAALEAARALGAESADCFFVGDSDVDMRTARNAGMVPVGVSWGYRGVEELKAAGASRVLDRPEDLAGLSG